MKKVICRTTIGLQDFRHFNVYSDTVDQYSENEDSYIQINLIADSRAHSKIANLEDGIGEVVSSELSTKDMLIEAYNVAKDEINKTGGTFDYIKIVLSIYGAGQHAVTFTGTSYWDSFIRNGYTRLNCKEYPDVTIVIGNSTIISERRYKEAAKNLSDLLSNGIR